ncbi:MAG: DUF502 domain-containing protein [Gammaproteobacteria bacterium]|nr:DUF502 domain-containing protein [Gammaproteobacteria bacterium]
MKRLTRALLTGLTLLLPVVLSLQVALWMVTTLEGWLKSLWEIALPEQWYVPGLGALALLLLATGIGLSTRMWLLGLLWKMPGRLLEKVPVISYIYNTIKDFADMMGGKNFSEQSVVWVTLPQAQARLLGIVTKRGADKDSRLAQMIGDDELAVYLPMSYQAGGYMIIVKEAQVARVDMEPGDALRLIMSAGLGQRGTKS